MALSSTLAMVFNTLGHPVQEKLTRENFLLWKPQVLPAVHGVQLFGYLDSTKKKPEETVQVKGEDKVVQTVPNYEYLAWHAQDQQLLSYLNSSLSKEVLAQVATCTTSAETWKALQVMYSSQSRARVMHLRGKLANIKKGELSAAAYFAKMKGYADEMAAVGKKLEDDDVVSYILTGLDADYN